MKEKYHEKKLKITLGTLVLLGAGIVLARLGFAILEVSQASNPPPNNSFLLGSVAELTILPLLEAEAGLPGLVSEHGLSYLIQAGSSTILLDVGNNLDGMEPAPLDEKFSV